MKFVFNCTLVFVLALIMSACNGGGGSGGGSAPKVDPFDVLRNNPDVNKNAWFNSMAQICSEGEPRPGCNFKYDGSKINLQTDPHYSKLNGFSFSFKTFQDTRLKTEIQNEWDPCARVVQSVCEGGFVERVHEYIETFTNYEHYVKTPDGREINVRDWHLSKTFYENQLGGWNFGWRTTQPGNVNTLNDMFMRSPSGVEYGYNGTALNLARATGGQQGQDVMGTIAEQRADQVKGISEVLQAKFSLDADVSEQAAASLVDWSEIGSKRARTHADMAAFSKRVYGIELGRIEDVALMARDGKTELALKEMDSLVGEAAQNWRTSPETMREVLGFFYGSLMN
ncbi:MAG: hypothetical protein AB7F59_04705 [Bdellovibrionales bacterium]